MLPLPLLHLVAGLGALLLAPAPVAAGSVPDGKTCNVNNNRLLAGTNQFYSDCDSTTYCESSNSTCVHQGCRNAIFPLQKYPFATPPICGSGEFCPDEQSKCLPLVAVGDQCQLNRDDQCEPPPNFAQLRDTTGRGLNVNGSVCLNNICMWANATSGGTCVVENTAYTAYQEDGSEFVNIVSRGNCVAGLYCDAVQLKCLAVKARGQQCTADKECATYNCNGNNVCDVDPLLPKEVATYVYVIVAICILGGMLGTLAGLYFMHRRQRDAARAVRLQYWREQEAFRANLAQLQDAARAAATAAGGSAPASERGTYYGRGSEDSAVSPVAGKGTSGLRNVFADQPEDEYEDEDTAYRAPGPSAAQYDARQNRF